MIFRAFLDDFLNVFNVEKLERGGIKKFEKLKNIGFEGR